jgi:hypothetical protein
MPPRCACWRAPVARERAIREEEDADAILASINMKLEKCASAGSPPKRQ